MILRQVELLPYALPFRRPVRGETTRQGWLVALHDHQGRRGLGDAACWPGFGAGHAATAARLATLLPELSHASFADLAAVEAWAQLEAATTPEVACAVEVALLDLFAQRQGRSLAQLLAAHVDPALTPRDSVRLQVLVHDADQAAAACEAGVTCFKLKVSAADLDLPRARAIRAAIGPEATLRLDANGAWSTPAEALAELERFAELAPEWVEQPIPAGDLVAFAELRRQSPLPLALDEGLRASADLERALELAAADALVLKPTYLGGPLVALRLARRAHAAGVRVIATHALDSVVGRAAALALSACLPADEACGLAPALAADLGQLPAPLGGRQPLPTSPGQELGEPSLLVPAACGKKESP